MKNKKKNLNQSNNHNTLEEIREKGFVCLNSSTNKSAVQLIANQNFIQFLSEDSSENIDLLILYKNLVIFAFEKNDFYLLFNYSNDLEEESNSVKFYPDDKEKTEIIYDHIKRFNMQNPPLEFNDELEGDNELYTADNL